MNIPYSEPIMLPQNLNAAIAEMRFWLRIMFEHAKFIRGGLNPSVQQEQYIKTADYFAQNIEQLYKIANSLTIDNIEGVNNLVDSSINWVVKLRDFKIQLFNLLSKCQAIAQLPAALLDHIRREADFFLTMLYRLKGLPVPNEGILGIPNGDIPTSLVPKLLIPYQKENIIKIAMDQNQFWLRIHKEHGEVLLLIAYRPRIQEMLYEATARFEKILDSLLEEAKTIPPHPATIKAFNSNVYNSMKEWHVFLLGLFNDINHCEVPSGQINAPALILDHMAREAEYYLDVLTIINSLL